MTTQDPGGPPTDEIARNAARDAIALLTGRGNISFRIDVDDDLAVLDEKQGELIADAVMDAHTVTWEHDVNSYGQPVRRYVLRGAWEVDPEAVGK